VDRVPAGDMPCLPVLRGLAGLGNKWTACRHRTCPWSNTLSEYTGRNDSYQLVVSSSSPGATS